MKKIETLLNIDMGRKFDTPKKLNRSTKKLPAEIIDQLEAGEFTAEMIEALAKTYPIYRYRTCITVHGNWPEITRNSIAGYKNVIQNKNGSVEIRYSAIDTEKKKRIKQALRSINSDLCCHEDSQGSQWRVQREVTKETIETVKAELTDIADRVKTCNIYGQISIGMYNIWGTHFLILFISPLAIPETEVHNFCLQLTGLTADEFATKAKEVQDKNEANRLQWEKEAQERADRTAAAKAPFEAQIAHLQPCNDLDKGILVKVTAGREEVKFSLVRKDGAGTFGRIKYSRGWVRTLTEEPTWKEMKQEKQRNIPLSDYKLLVTSEASAAPIKTKPEPQKKAVRQAAPPPQIHSTQSVLFTVTI